MPGSTDCAGPLSGLKVLEIESIGPGPFAAMALADLGASVLRIVRPEGTVRRSANPVLERGRAATIAVDLKSARGSQTLLALVERADALIEGFRPGVMERLGLSPEECLKRHPRLVYGRVTGWGRSGPFALTAGHDINYIALTGALYALGTAESGPVPPLNLVGDFGGGGLLLAFGIVCALLNARASGHGQIVDASMIEGTGMLMSMIHGLHATGRWPAARAGNVLDGSAYYYTCYRCACGGWVAVGAIEPEFRRRLLELLGLGADAPEIMQAADDDAAVRQRLAGIFSSKTRDEWQHLFDGTDACVTPVLSIDEVPKHPHNIAAENFRLIDGVMHPAAAPRFSRTPAAPPGQSPSADFRSARLEEWGLTGADVV